MSNQKRTRTEFEATKNVSIGDLVRHLKALDLSSYVPNYNIRTQILDYSEIDPPNALYLKPKCSIHLEDAPDGLPHLLAVDRSVKISNVIETHLGAKLENLRVEMGDVFHDHIISLDRALHTKCTKFDILDHYFLPQIPLNRLIGATILARILDKKSPRNSQTSNISTAYPSSPAYSPTSPICGSSSPAYAPVHNSRHESHEAQRAKKTWLKKQKSAVYLAIDIGAPESLGSILSVDSNPPNELSPKDCLSYRRDFPSTEEEIRENLENGIPFHREDFKSIGGILVQNPNRTFFGDHSAALVFDIRRVLIGFSTAAHILHFEHHSKGLVHCDLTPTNILVLSDSFLPIDSMEIPIGALAPGGTLEWSAPEQILYRPVSDKTDVYSIALMVLTLLGGLMFGQVVEYVVASRPQNTEIKKYSLETVKLIPCPELTLGAFESEEENSGLPSSPVDRIRNFLRLCLQLDPLVRPTMLELADALIEYSHSLPIGHECLQTLNGGFGDGTLYSWVVEGGPNEYFWRTTYTVTKGSFF